MCTEYTTYHTAAAAKLLQSCPTLCDPRDGSPPGFSVPGNLQARTLEWIAISFSSAWKWKVKVKLLSCVWLFSDPMDCSPPGSSIHGIFQARALEWGAIAFSDISHYWVDKPGHLERSDYDQAVKICKGSFQRLNIWFKPFNSTKIS